MEPLRLLRAAARLLVLLTLAVLAPVAQAGHYQAGTTSGLTATFAGVGHAYPPTYGSGSASASAPGSNGAGSISGTLSTTFTWVPDYAGDTAPTNVIVSETCDVEAEAKKYAGGSPTATASNGLDARFCTNASGSGPYGANGVDASASSSGTAPHVQAGGSAVTVNDCGPSGQTSTSNGPSTLTLTYSVTVTPVTITFSGVLNPQTDKRLLTGQRLTATVSGVPSGLGTSYSWSIGSGTPFTSYSPSTARADPPTPWASTNTASTSCFFAKPVSDPGANVSCTVSIPNVGNCTVYDNVVVVPPDHFTRNVSKGAWDLRPNRQSPDTFYLKPVGASLGGFSFDANVTTPPDFAGGGDKGSWYYVQIASPNTTVTFNDGTSQPGESNGLTGCDAQFPYPDIGGPHAAIANNYVSFLDTPNISIDIRTSGMGTATAHYDGSFSTYVLYVPPGDSTFVPILAYYWGTNGTTTRGTPDWTVYDTPSSVVGPSTDIAHPTWTTTVNSEG